MIELFKSWKGKVSINGTVYDSISQVPDDISFSDDWSIKLLPITNTETSSTPASKITTVETPVEYRITVKKYMTKPSTPGFDFMSKWNHDIPMPLCTMVGTKEKETKGMVYMKLHADTTFKKVMCCMKCGRPITNPVSQYFGMGPECGRHNYVNPFDTEEELQEAVKQYKQNVLGKIEWEGWVIRSSILKEEIINE